MSYILDALRRAQAERERGQVPGLHAQPGLGGAQRLRPTGGAAASASAGTQRTLPAWVWGLGGAAVVAVLTVPLWLSVRGGGAPLPVTGAAVPPMAPVAAVPVAPQAPPLVVVSAPAQPQTPKTAAGAAAAPAPRPGSPAAAVATAAAASASATRLLPAEVGAPAVPAPTPPQIQAQAGLPAGAEAAAAPAPSNSRAAAANPPAAAAALPPTLTAEQRRDWPPLAVGGSVWSDTPSARFVILGGQVVREGESTADGVLVERITPKAVVLRWRDQRGSLPM